MPKILVVDDEPDMEALIRQKFRRKIRSGEMAFAFAQNGREALQRLEEEPDIDMILSDINMPVMDGLTLLGQLAEARPEVKAVIVTAYGDMPNIRTAMNRGAIDFLTKPIDFDDLDVTVANTLRHLEQLRDALRNRDRLTAIRQELDVARRMQASILPPDALAEPTFDLACSMTPAQEVGGDFYDWFRIDDRRFGVVIADVSGKGIAAGLFMMVSRAVLRGTAVQEGEGPGATLARVNNLLCEGNETAMFVTLFYGVLDTATGAFVYANAGHNPPYRIAPGGGAEPLPGTGGMALGVMEDLPYGEQSLSLHPGETLFLFTDGVTEAINPAEEEFGDPRLAEVLDGAGGLEPAALTATVVEAVQGFADGAPQADDITCLTLRYKGS